MEYGELPAIVRQLNIDVKEMMFYQYLPIKLKEQTKVDFEPRLFPFSTLIIHCLNDFKNSFGVERFVDSYIYLTAKRQFQSKSKLFNRPGYHSDGFLTDDINYIWSDKNPTIFNSTKFNLTLDDELSLIEMEEQALQENETIFPDSTILRLNQFNIHKVNENVEEGFRTFFKLSFSYDKYDLEGNSHNYQLEYDWNMKPRKSNRNIPQSDIK